MKQNNCLKMLVITKYESFPTLSLIKKYYLAIKYLGPEWFSDNDNSNWKIIIHI